MSADAPIRFLLDGEVREVAVADPTRTVLQYLREDLHRTGTKEGCAEGDCGACTVALAELDASGERIRVRAVNACIQFLPTLDGKELITVESLRGNDGSLHPVQQAMVDCHGSQCGFCTPGFVMSLFALYKTNPDPSRREIDDALAGNLCRCTGYKPIIDAARAMYAGRRRRAGGWLRQPCNGSARTDPDRAETLRALRRSRTLEIENAGRRYYAPQTLDELAELVQAHADAVVLAGGTDVGLWVTKQLQELGTVIYLGNVAELGRIEERDGALEIGAAASLTDVMPHLHARFPELDELMLRFASPPIRNAGTVGGNVANGSPIGDTMPALLALDTSLILRRGKATREMPLAEFYLDYQQTALEPGEFVERIRIPRRDADSRVQSYKVSKRFDQDISAVCGAYQLWLDGKNVRDIRIAYGGMAAVPKRAVACESTLRGKKWDERRVRDAMAELDHDFTPIGDMRSSAGYRRTVCRNLLYRFYLDSSGSGPASVYAYGRQD